MQLNCKMKSKVKIEKCYVLSLNYQDLHTVEILAKLYVNFQHNMNSCHDGQRLYRNSANEAEGNLF